MLRSPLTRQDFEELKAAGFPMHNRIEGSVCGLCNSGCLICSFTACMPTLSELIAACGRDFSSLYLGDDGYWTAISERRSRLELWETPEKAVKNLYVALNKK